MRQREQPQQGAEFSTTLRVLFAAGLNTNPHNVQTALQLPCTTEVAYSAGAVLSQ
jgi:hypothetical protein